MQMRWAAVLLVGVVIGAAVASITWAVLGVPVHHAEGAGYFIDIIALEAETDEKGCFAADYALDEGGIILGMVAAIRNVGGDWHTMETGGDQFNNFWWHDVAASGCLADPSYAQRPARVLLFVGYPQ